MPKKNTAWQKIKFIMFDDSSMFSWFFDILFAFILIKFVVYPGLGFLLGTSHPIVAVVSGSMEHDGSFDGWWTDHDEFYLKAGISKDEFLDFPFRNGFNTGDIMILKGRNPEDIVVGNVVVYHGPNEPIIHRVVKRWKEDEEYYYQTKGDHNPDSNPNERRLREDTLIGYQKYNKGSVALLRIPYLGWIKIGFVKLLSFAGF